MQQSKGEREREVGEVLAKFVGVLHAEPERINLDRVCSLFMRKHVLIDCQLDCVASERRAGGRPNASRTKAERKPNESQVQAKCKPNASRTRAPFRMTLNRFLRSVSSLKRALISAEYGIRREFGRSERAVTDSRVLKFRRIQMLNSKWLRDGQIQMLLVDSRRVYSNAGFQSLWIRVPVDLKACEVWIQKV